MMCVAASVCAYPDNTLMTIVKECHLQTETAGSYVRLGDATPRPTRPSGPPTLHMRHTHMVPVNTD